MIGLDQQNRAAISAQIRDQLIANLQVSARPARARTNVTQVRSQHVGVTRARVNQLLWRRRGGDPTH